MKSNSNLSNQSSLILTCILLCLGLAIGCQRDEKTSEQLKTEYITNDSHENTGLFRAGDFTDDANEEAEPLMLDEVINSLRPDINLVCDVVDKSTEYYDIYTGWFDVACRAENISSYELMDLNIIFRMYDEKNKLIEREAVFANERLLPNYALHFERMLSPFVKPSTLEITVLQGSSEILHTYNGDMKRYMFITMIDV